MRLLDNYNKKLSMDLATGALLLLYHSMYLRDNVFKWDVRLNDHDKIITKNKHRVG